MTTGDPHTWTEQPDAGRDDIESWSICERCGLRVYEFVKPLEGGGREGSIRFVGADRRDYGQKRPECVAARAAA